MIKREGHSLVDFTISYDFYIAVRGRVHLCHHTCGSNYVACPTLCCDLRTVPFLSMLGAMGSVYPLLP